MGAESVHRTLTPGKAWCVRARIRWAALGTETRLTGTLPSLRNSVVNGDEAAKQRPEAREASPASCHEEALHEEPDLAGGDAVLAWASQSQGSDAGTSPARARLAY